MDDRQPPPLGPPQPWLTGLLGWPRIDIVDGSDLLHRLLGDRSLRAVVGGVEAFVGFITLVFVILGGVGLLGGSVLFNAWAYHYPRIDRSRLELMTAAWVVSLVLILRSIGFFVQALETAAVPIPLTVARRWLSTPSLARLPVAAWWMVLSATTLVASHYASTHIEFFRPTWYERTLQVAIPIAFLYGSAFAVNTNVLIATAALTGSDGVTRALWRVRLLVDLLAITWFLFDHAPAR